VHLAAFRSRPDRELGFASFVEYLDGLFGFGPKVAREKIRVAEALEMLPGIARGPRPSARNRQSVHAPR
jgi:hypothetical protein